MFSAAKRARAGGPRLTAIGLIPYATDAFCYCLLHFLHRQMFGQLLFWLAYFCCPAYLMRAKHVQISSFNMTLYHVSKSNYYARFHV